MRNKIVRALPWLLKFAVSIALIWYLLGGIEVTAILAEIRKLSGTALIAAFALISTQAALGAMRWKVVIEAIGGQLRLIKAVEITFVGLFFNQFLPASIGADIVRMWQSSRAGLALPTAVSSVMLERFSNLLSIFAMSLLTIPVLASYANVGNALEVIVVVSAAGLLGLGVLLNLDRLPTGWREFRVFRGAARLAKDARALFFHRRFALEVFATAVMGQFALAAAVWILALGLNIEVRLVDCIVLMPPVVLISSLPISVAGWGVREMAMVGAFGMLSVPNESALALSVIVALVATTVSLPGGLLWLASRRPNSIGSETRTSSEARKSL